MDFNSRRVTVQTYSSTYPGFSLYEFSFLTPSLSPPTCEDGDRRRCDDQWIFLVRERVY